MLFFHIPVTQVKFRGVTALRCRGCLAGAVHEVRAISTRSWVYGFVPLWSKHLLYETLCTRCELRIPFQGDDSPIVVPNTGLAFEDLARETYPEALIGDHSLEAAEDEDQLASQMFEARLTASAMMFEYANAGVAPDPLLRRVAALGVYALCLIVSSTIALFILMGPITPNHGPHSPPLQWPFYMNALAGLLLVAIAAFILLLLASAVLWLTRVDRQIRREALPVLVRYLECFELTAEDLMPIWQNFKKRKLYIAKAIKPHRLIQHIERYRAMRELERPPAD